MGRVGAQRSWCPDHSTTKPWYIVHRKATSTVDFCPNWESANPGPEDAVAVLWELARPLQQDGRVAEFNRVLAYVYASNTNAQPLGGEAMLTAVAKYVVGYCAKNPVQLENILSTIRQVSVGPVLPRATNSVLRSGATRCERGTTRFEQSRNSVPDCGPSPVYGDNSTGLLGIEAKQKPGEEPTEGQKHASVLKRMISRGVPGGGGGKACTHIASRQLVLPNLS